jgi:hypothetical protein
MKHLQIPRVRWHNKRFHSRPGYVADFWDGFVTQYFSLFQSLAQFTARRVERSVILVCF